MTADTDIIVAGTGPAGLMAALSLAQTGLGVVLAGPPVRRDDRRTTALMQPSLAFLDRLGLLEETAAGAAALKVMRIVDATRRLMRSPVVTFRAAEIGEERFGLNIPNAHLLEVLAAAIDRETSIRRIASTVERWDLADDRATAAFADGTMLSARLAVAADGRASPARAAAGVTVHSTATGQSALVLDFAHTRPHDDTSTEFHTEDGPFTVVPLTGLRSSLVWVTKPRVAETLLASGDDELSRAIETRMQSMLGRVTVEPGRQIYALGSALPRRFADRRVALVGEAAHVFPPIGAQGLNLGIRDIEDLTRTVEAHRADPGAPDALGAYDRARRPDILARSSAVGLLNRSLLSNLPPVQLARAAGLGMLAAEPPLRALFMREGLRTGSGLGALLDGPASFRRP